MPLETSDRRINFPGEPTPDEVHVLSAVLEAMRGMQHGTVAVIVQDRRVVQIDRTDKRRLVR